MRREGRQRKEKRGKEGRWEERRQGKGQGLTVMKNSYFRPCLLNIAIKIPTGYRQIKADMPLSQYDLHKRTVRNLTRNLQVPRQSQVQPTYSRGRSRPGPWGMDAPV